MSIGQHRHFIFLGYRNDRFFPIQILIFQILRNCRCSLMLIFRAWATCAIKKYKALISGMSDFANLNDYTACRQTLNGKLSCIHIHLRF